MAFVAIFDIPYGVYTYCANRHSWPEYVINKTIYTIARHGEYSVFTSMDNDFDINQFLKLVTECYKSEKKSCREASLKEIKVEQSQLRGNGIKQYTYVYYRKRYGTCQLESQEVYDLETGELLGRSSEMMLNNIIFAPFYNSLLGGPSFGTLAGVEHNRGLSYDVFPRLREDVVKPLSGKD